VIQNRGLWKKGRASPTEQDPDRDQSTVNRCQQDHQRTHTMHLVDRNQTERFAVPSATGETRNRKSRSPPHESHHTIRNLLQPTFFTVDRQEILLGADRPDLDRQALRCHLAPVRKGLWYQRQKRSTARVDKVGLG
jgi:hypothetical protein